MITDPEEMTSIWASHLLRDDYEYVIFAEPDEEIRAVAAMIAPQLGEVKDGMVVKVIPADSSYGITLIP